MATQLAASHNPGARSSGKTGNSPVNSRVPRHLPLAAKVARTLGLVPTWPNVQTIRLAIESEAEHFSVAAGVIADMLVRAAKELSHGPEFRCPSPWEDRELFRLNTIDRFWFEDARWRSKFAYAEFREGLKAREAC